MTFAAYIESIKRQPNLSAEEEIELVAKMRGGDARAREKLCAAHMKLCWRVAKSFKGYRQHDPSDLLSAGATGLIRALDRFDATNGARISTYAIYWIRSAIQEYVMTNHSITKIGTNAEQKRIFFSANKVMRSLGITEPTRMTHDQVQQVADALQVTTEQLVNTLQRMRVTPSLDAPLVRDNEDVGAWIDFVPSEAESVEDTLGEAQETAIRLKVVYERLAQLTERERAIIKARVMSDKPSTLDELARHFGVARERVRQVEAMALFKLAGSVGPPPSSTGYKSSRLRMKKAEAKLAA